MAQLAIATAGAAIGFALGGPFGAQVGWVAGSVLGATMTPGQNVQGPRLEDLKVTGSSYGAPIPFLAAHPRVAGQIVWASTKREIATTTSSGGKGGGGGVTQTSYIYEIDLLILVSDNPIGGVSRVFLGGDLIFTNLSSASADSLNASAETNKWSRLTVYPGGSSQLPDPTYEAAVGIGNAPAYRGRGTVFIQSLQLGSSGQLPNLTFETYQGATTNFPTTIFAAGYYKGSDLDQSYYNVGAGSYTTPTAFTQKSEYLQLLYSKFEAAGLTYSSPSFLRPSSTDMTVEYLFDLSLGVSQVRPYYATRLGAFCMGTDPGTGFTIGLNGNVGSGPNYLNLGGYPAFTWTDSIDAFGRTHHVAVVYASDNTGRVYVNGNYVGAVGISISATQYLGIAGYGVAAPQIVTDFLIRYRGVRVTKAQVYTGTGTYTVPTTLKPDRISYTLLDDTLQNVVTTLMLRSGLSAGQFDASLLASITRPVRSLAVSQVTTTRSVLEMLMATYFFEAVLSDKIYFRPRGAAAVLSIPYSDVGYSTDGSEPLPLTKANELEIPAQFALTYSNVNSDYQSDTQYSDRLLTGMESTSTAQVPFGFTSSEAKVIVDTQLYDRAIASLSTKITLGIQYAALEPTDVVNVTAADGSTFKFRLSKKSEAMGLLTFDAVAEDATVLVQTGTTSGGNTGQGAVDSVYSSTLTLLEIPLLRDADNYPGYYYAVSAQDAAWPGASVYNSLDDVSYDVDKTILTAATIGTTTTALGNWTGGTVFDETNTVTVSVGVGQLASTTRANMLASTTANAALIGNELVQFRDAALVSAGVYRLSGFMRGRRGTEDQQASHSIGERFVLLNLAGLRFYAGQTSDLGKLKYWRAVTQGQKLSAATAQSQTMAATVLKPFAPVDARANRTTTDTVITWKRRTRLSTTLVGAAAINAPLGETTEAYEVEVYTSSAFTTLKRTITSLTAASATYTSAQQVADFGSNQSSLFLKIYQLSATVGRGTALTVTV